MKSHICTTRFTSVQLIGFLDTGYQFFVSPSGNGAGLGVTPWWTKWMNTGQADIVPAQETTSMSPFGLGLGVLDLGWDPMNGRHMTTKPSSFPKLFAPGGFTDEPYNDEFMKYYGLSWVPASQIQLSDPNFNAIQRHDPNGTYAVDSYGYYVPAGKMKAYWDAYQSLPSKTTEYVVTPDSQTETTLARFRSAVPDSRLRNGLNDYLSRYVGDKSQNELINAYLNLHEKFGSPEYGVATGSRSMTPYVISSYLGRSLPKLIGMGDIAIERQLFDPSLSTEYRRFASKMPPQFRYTNGSRLGWMMLDEFPHFAQYHANEHGQRLSDNAPRSLLTGHFPDFESLPGTGLTAYNDLGNTEYQAHGPIKAGIMSRITGQPVNRFMHRHDPWYAQNKEMFSQTMADDNLLDDYLWNSTQSASRFAGDKYRRAVKDGSVTPTPSSNDGFFGNLWGIVHYPYALINGLFGDLSLPERKQ